jgi:hypothetical protein
MTPCPADLKDVLEGKKIAVIVADGHIIKCPAMGKIRIQMLVDKGNQLEAPLYDVLYVPGLSLRLFSITHLPVMDIMQSSKMVQHLCTSHLHGLQ